MNSEYQRKRNFRKTPEPENTASDRARKSPFFVIQQHHASTDHYDFRLAIDGVLKSWAVPKGLSTDPRDKRLAIQTEDHPLDYADFEGVIPQGEYGAGPVLIWDRGEYHNVTHKDGEIREVADALADGHLLVDLAGEKLSGGYVLQRLEDAAEENAWLIIKMKDDAADARRNPVSTQPESVVSGRTIEELE